MPFKQSGDEQDFVARNTQKIREMAADDGLSNLSLQWMVDSGKYEYSYHFHWMGRPIIQYPQDMIALQEIIWETKPDVIVETGVARGGSVVFFASMLHLLGGDGHVIGVDIEIRPHNRAAIEQHPMFERITLIEQSSTENDTIEQVAELCRGKRVLVVLDSNHTHDHVFKELELYSPLVTHGQYIVVLDTIVEDFPHDSFPNRPWDKGDNPKTAVWEFLKANDRFEIDRDRVSKLLLTAARDGYLLCVKD